MAFGNRLVPVLLAAVAMSAGCKHLDKLPDDVLPDEYRDVIPVLQFVVALASEAEQAEAKEEAARQREAMQAERIAELEAENRMLAVQVNESGDRVIVDPKTGEPVNDNVYRAPAPAPEAPDAGTSEAPTVQTEPTEGELDGYNVVFVPRKG